MARRHISAVLSDVHRTALRRKLLALAELERQATLEKKVGAAQCWAVGMVDEEIAEVFGISRSTAMAWRREGEEELTRRAEG